MGIQGQRGQVELGDLPSEVVVGSDKAEQGRWCSEANWMAHNPSAQLLDPARGSGWKMEGSKSPHSYLSPLSGRGAEDRQWGRELAVPGPRELGSQESSECCNSLWGWPGVAVSSFHVGSVEAVGSKGWPWGARSPQASGASLGAMAGASLVRARGADQQITLGPFPGAWPYSPSSCQPRVVCRGGTALWGGHWRGGAQGPTGGWEQGPENPVTL